MSYTAPQYVDTKEQAIIALASTIKGEAVTGGDGSVNRALDVLADVLAQQDVQVPQTDAGAILALAQYVSGGGGGGGSSDLTTAEVTFVNNTGGSINVTFATVRSFPNGDGFSTGSVSIRESGGKGIAILYKGTGSVFFGESVSTITVSGNATVDGPNVVIITGDCTITVS